MNETKISSEELLAAYSDGLAAAVERAGRSVVRVEARRQAPASGVVWSEALVVTADHVLEREEDLRVGLPDGSAVSATLAGRDPGTDLALLRLQGQSLTPIERAPAPKVGQVALVVARPGAGLETSIGVVSAITGPARTWRGGRLDGVIRTDAVMYPGFSGGPLVDAAGRMVGLATSQLGRGAGLAIPLQTVERVSTSLQQHGRVRRGFLGVTSQAIALPAPLRDRLGLSQESGLLISGLEADGPAEQAGLLVGDVLVALADQTVRHAEDLLSQLGPERVGQATSVKLIRAGELRELPVTVGERQ
jgi:S1-C subfamily serine protease